MHYRVYGIGLTGNFAWGMDAICENDAEAALVARSVPLPELRREVWRGTTRVCLQQVCSPGYDAVTPINNSRLGLVSRNQ